MTLLRIYYHGGEQEKINIRALEFHPEMLQTLSELGIIEIQEDCLTPDQLQRIYKLLRLKNCLGVNLPGAAIILELLDRIEKLQGEIEKLQRSR
ncbi:MAG: chaperone modulator CbpM [Armatimonadetes bacterium]|nr:chaperone modulator CbpM [Armatimonadota bacterium]